jgi:cyanate permease
MSEAFVGRCGFLQWNDTFPELVVLRFGSGSTGVFPSAMLILTVWLYYYQK